jgi:hypothetical protein
LFVAILMAGESMSQSEVRIRTLMIYPLNAPIMLTINQKIITEKHMPGKRKHIAPASFNSLYKIFSALLS